MTERRRIEVLIGPIASGKSTYARERAKDGAMIVSHDALTEMLHGEYRYEEGLRDCYRRMEEELVEMILLRVNRDVVIDRTHLTAESRKRWVYFAHGRMADCVAVQFANHGPQVHSTRRFNSNEHRGRSQEEWLKVAEHHQEQALLEPLDWAAEGFTAFKDLRGMQCAS